VLRDCARNRIWPARWGCDRNFAAALSVALALTAQEGKFVPARASNLSKSGDLEDHASANR